MVDKIIKKRIPQAAKNISDPKTIEEPVSCQEMRREMLSLIIDSKYK